MEPRRRDPVQPSAARRDYPASRPVAARRSRCRSLDASLRESTHRWVQFLPDGKHFFYLAVPGSGPSAPCAIRFTCRRSIHPGRAHPAAPRTLERGVCSGSSALRVEGQTRRAALRREAAGAFRRSLSGVGGAPFYHPRATSPSGYLPPPKTEPWSTRPRRAATDHFRLMWWKPGHRERGAPSEGDSADWVLALAGRAEHRCDRHGPADRFRGHLAVRPHPRDVTPHHHHARGE